MTARTPRIATSKTTPTVDEFLAALAHPCLPEIDALRRLILSVDPAIQEEVKWNAPSFRTTEHFATMHLRDKTGIRLILHFGAKKTVQAQSGAAVPDPHGLLTWLAKDRATVAIANLEDLDSKRTALTAVLRHWIALL